MISSLHTAIGKCTDCGELVISPGGGRMRNCSCGKSFIDQERWAAVYVRTGGNIELIEQICPYNCEYQNKDAEDSFSHSSNRQFREFEDVQDYMLKTYGVKWNKKKFDWVK